MYEMVKLILIQSTVEW